MIALAGFIKRSAICFKSALQNKYLIKSLLSTVNYTGINMGIILLKFLTLEYFHEDLR